MPEGETLHATCVVVGEAGLLIRGDAGSGKSTLARTLIQAARQDGRFARLVSDDRTRIRASHGRLVAEAVAPIAGRIEVRGAGILPAAYERRAVVRLIVDLSAEEPPRLPELQDTTIVLCGIMVPRLRQRLGAPWQDLVLRGLSGGIDDTFVTV
jgi:serine kinase of HPr protein (carbohydrate metabolism regulator)